MKFDRGWSSFIPTLLKAVQNTEGPILELGSGLFSTPLLHWICEENSRILITYENSEGYYRFARKFRTTTHQVSWVFEKDWLDKIKWSVVFIDNGISKKDARRRGDDALSLKNSAEYIILHDTQFRDDDAYGYDTMWKEFKYIYHANVSPRTSVVSNVSDLKIFNNKRDKKV